MGGTVPPMSTRDARAPAAAGELIERPRTGPDRVALVEGGIQHVAEGRETFVRFRDLYAVVEHEGLVYLLVPRTLPAPPWLVVHAGMIEDRSPGALARFAARARQGGESGGYRDAVRRHRQGMSREELWRRVRAREALPGMMEVPPTQPRADPTVSRVQAAIVVLGSSVVLVPGMLMPFLSGRAGELAVPFVMLFGLGWPLVMIVLAVTVGRYWRAARAARLPRRRVLVLAPDGCVVGARDGIRSLEWSHVSGFRVDAVGPSREPGLVVYGARGERLCDVEARFLAAPLGLVVAVAEAYRQAAR